MKILAPVSDIMSKCIIQVNITDSLTKAEQLFKTHKIRHIPVVSHNKIVGMLSYTDLLKASFADFSDNDEAIEHTVYNMFSIEQVMTKDVVTIYSYTPIKEAAEILSQNDFRALPVVYEDHLVGIVTTTDLIKYLLSKF